MDTIERARGIGFKVRVQHQRPNEKGKLVYASRKTKTGDIPPRGGMTTVTLSKGGLEISEISRCNFEDNFSYKTGTRLALERAYESFKWRKLTTTPHSKRKESTPL